MKTSIKEITPEWAAEILEKRNPNNRNISEATIEKYAKDMENGDWCLTHQGIAIDLNGHLIDGQHRLAAVVKAKRVVRMMVTYGVPTSFNNNGHKTETFSCIDGVKPRGPGVVLQIMHYKNPNNVAAVARAIAMIVTDTPKTHITGTITERIVRFCGGSIERIVELSTSKKILRLRGGTMAVLAFYHTTQPEWAENFQLEVQGVTGAKNSPSRALATWLSHHPATGGSAQLDAIYVTSSALFHATQGNTTEKLYGSKEHIAWLQKTNGALTKRLKDIVG